MDEYIAKRKEYIQQVRASFDKSNEISDIYATNIEDNYFKSNGKFKTRCLISFLIFIIVFFCHYNSYTIFGIEVSEIIDRISDNRYYTFLENCDILENDNYSERINHVLKTNDE